MQADCCKRLADGLEIAAVRLNVAVGGPATLAGDDDGAALLDPSPGWIGGSILGEMNRGVAFVTYAEQQHVPVAIVEPGQRRAFPKPVVERVRICDPGGAGATRCERVTGMIAPDHA